MRGCIIYTFINSFVREIVLPGEKSPGRKTVFHFFLYYRRKRMKVRNLLIFVMILIFIPLSLYPQNAGNNRSKKPFSRKTRQELYRAKRIERRSSVEYLAAKDRSIERKIEEMLQNIKELKEERLEIQKQIRNKIGERIEENRKVTERLKKQKADLRKEKIERIDQKIKRQEEELKELNRLRNSYQAQKPQKKEKSDSLDVKK